MHAYMGARLVEVFELVPACAYACECRICMHTWALAFWKPSSLYLHKLCVPQSTCTRTCTCSCSDVPAQALRVAVRRESAIEALLAELQKAISDAAVHPRAHGGGQSGDEGSERIECDGAISMESRLANQEQNHLTELRIHRVIGFGFGLGVRL